MKQWKEGQSRSGEGKLKEEGFRGSLGSGIQGQLEKEGSGKTGER